MRYLKVNIGGTHYWTASPQTPEELAFTINNEKPFLNADPSSTEVNITVLNMFL